MATLNANPIKMVRMESRASTWAGVKAGSGERELFTSGEMFADYNTNATPPRAANIILLEFATSYIPASATINSAYLNATYGGGWNNQTTYIDIFDFGSDITIADWYTGFRHPATLSLPYYSGNFSFPTSAVSKATNTRLVAYAQNMFETFPDGSNYGSTRAVWTQFQLTVDYTVPTYGYTIRYWYGAVGGRSAGTNYAGSAAAGTSYSSLVTAAGGVDKYRLISDCDAGSHNAGTIQTSGSNYIDVVYPLNNQSMFLMF